MHLRVGSKEKEIYDCCEICRTDSSYITGIHTLSRSFQAIMLLPYIAKYALLLLIVLVQYFEKMKCRNRKDFLFRFELKKLSLVYEFSLCHNFVLNLLYLYCLCFVFFYCGRRKGLEFMVSESNCRVMMYCTQKLNQFR